MKNPVYYFLLERGLELEGPFEDVLAADADRQRRAPTEKYLITNADGLADLRAAIDAKYQKPDV